jgi:hypothetical protein
MLVFLLSPGFPAMAFVHALPNIPRMAVSNLLPAKRGGLYARAGAWRPRLPRARVNRRCAAAQVHPGDHGPTLAGAEAV